MPDAPAPPAPGKPAPPPDLWAPIRTPRFWVLLLILFAVNLILSNVLFSSGQPQTVTIPYNVFVQQITDNNVVSITSTADTIVGTTRKAVSESPGGASSTKFQTQRPQFASDDLEALLQNHNVMINAKDPTPPTPLFLTLLPDFGPTLLLVLLLPY